MGTTKWSILLWRGNVEWGKKQECPLSRMMLKITIKGYSSLRFTIGSRVAQRVKVTWTKFQDLPSLVSSEKCKLVNMGKGCQGDQVRITTGLRLWWGLSIEREAEGRLIMSGLE